MITAIFVIVIMSTVAMLVFSLSGKMVKGTAIQYRTEQAALLARSYTELAVMAVIHHERNATSHCIENIDGNVTDLIPGTNTSGATVDNGGGYSVQTRIYYIGNGLSCSSVRILNPSTPIVTNYNTTLAHDALAAIIVDVYVRYKDPAAAAINSSSAPWITYHSRRLLKI